MNIRVTSPSMYVMRVVLKHIFLIDNILLQKIDIDPRDLDFSVDCKMFMNPSPYTVSEGTSAPRLFRLFRALGLRHMVVVDQDHRVCGIITRQDLVHRH